jgi:transcriptional regulator with XRE-family HTH domain
MKIIFVVLPLSSIRCRLENCGMKIGQVIRKIRLEKGATLEEVALAAGTDPANLSRVERNMQQLTPETLEKIAEALGMPVSSLYLIAEQTVVPYEAKSDKEDTDKSAARLEDFVAKFMLLTPENQQLLIEFAGAMLKSQAK